MKSYYSVGLLGITAGGFCVGFAVVADDSWAKVFHLTLASLNFGSGMYNIIRAAIDDARKSEVKS